MSAKYEMSSKARTAGAADGGDGQVECSADAAAEDIEGQASSSDVNMEAQRVSAERQTRRDEFLQKSHVIFTCGKAGQWIIKRGSDEEELGYNFI